jgi:TPR repeat protein
MKLFPQPIFSLRHGFAAATVAALAFAVLPGRGAEIEGPVLMSKTGGGPAWSTMPELEAAVKKGNPKAKAQLGDLLLRGEGVNPDPARALPLLDEAARAGEAGAAFRLGMTLLADNVVDSDPPRAAAYLRAAAVGGNDEAFRNLGVLYSKGRNGVKRDYTEALAWLILAEKHDTAETVGKDLRKYLTRIQRAEFIAAGEKRAPLLEAELAKTTVAQSLPPAGPFAIIANAAPLKMTAVSAAGSEGKDAAASSSADSSTTVKLIAPTGRTLSWPSTAALERAAEQGRPEAQTALGQVLLEGKYLSEDSARAAQVLEKAADAGSADAAYLLSELYAKGTRINRDDAKAFKYTLQAAKGGVLTATFNLGALYTSGRGTPVSYSDALTWFIVAKNFNRDAGQVKKIGDYLKQTKPEQIPLAEKRAAELIREINTARDNLPGL